MQFYKTLLIGALSLLVGCTTDHPIATGALGGAAAGAGIGAIVGRSSSSISVPKGIGVGAAIGVPAGILLAYTSDAVAKYYILKGNDEEIVRNYKMILDNQDEIERERQLVILDAPQGLPDQDLAEYIYLGPSLGNPWR